MQQNAARNTPRILDRSDSEYQCIVIDRPAILNISKLDCTHGTLCSTNTVRAGTKLDPPDAEPLFIDALALHSLARDRVSNPGFEKEEMVIC
jgi:hypothetical protein